MKAVKNSYLIVRWCLFEVGKKEFVCVGGGLKGSDYLEVVGIFRYICLDVHTIRGVEAYYLSLSFLTETTCTRYLAGTMSRSATAACETPQTSLRQKYPSKPTYHYHRRMQLQVKRDLPSEK